MLEGLKGKRDPRNSHKRFSSRSRNYQKIVMQLGGGEHFRVGLCVTSYASACVSGWRFALLVCNWQSWFRTISRIHIRHVYQIYQTHAGLLFCFLPEKTIDERWSESNLRMSATGLVSLVCNSISIHYTVLKNPLESSRKLLGNPRRKVDFEWLNFQVDFVIGRRSQMF